MREERFIISVKQEVEKWLAFLDFNIKRNNLQILAPFTFFSMLRIARSPHHYIVEFLGSQKFDPLKNGNYRVEVPRKAERISSTEAYFLPGVEHNNISVPLFNIQDCREGVFSGLGICHSFDGQAFSRKIQFDLPQTILQGDFMNVPFGISPESHIITFLNISIVINDLGRPLFRYINAATVFRHDVTEADISAWTSTTVARYGS